MARKRNSSTRFAFIGLIIAVGRLRGERHAGLGARFGGTGPLHACET